MYIEYLTQEDILNFISQIMKEQNSNSQITTVSFSKETYPKTLVFNVVDDKNSTTYLSQVCDYEIAITSKTDLKKQMHTKSWAKYLVEIFKTRLDDKNHILSSKSYIDDYNYHRKMLKNYKIKQETKKLNEEYEDTIIK